MVALIDKLEGLFKEKYPDCDLDLYTRLDDSHVGGFLLTDRFEGKPMEDRQREVWELLRSNLDSEEILAITGIFTQTRNEHAIMVEENEAD